MNRLFLLLCYALLFLASCVDDYETPVIPTQDGLLVVEGFINSDGPTKIQLSHTIALNDETDKPLPELKAQISVEGEDNITRYLEEEGAGSYGISQISIDKTKKYRIRIKTIDSKEYVSDFVEVTQTPPMDSVTWNIDYENRGLQFYVYTHDPENAAHYYHWEYFETWQYHSVYPTSWEYVKGLVVRNYSLLEKLYICWMTKQSTEILTTSTSKLSKDVVYRFPLAFLPASSEKLELGYRMLIKQYALTEDAFDYLQELKKNTEQLGSIFDNQPSQLIGNIKCISNLAEPVLGYVSAHGVEEKSIMIVSGGQLPSWFSGKTEYSQCPGPGGPQNYINILLQAGLYLPADNPLFPDIPMYQPKICVDCRQHGGTNIKPDYWPY